jgi:hypothetical protein
VPALGNSFVAEWQFTEVEKYSVLGLLSSEMLFQALHWLATSAGL